MIAMTILIDLVRLKVIWRSFHRWCRGIGPRLLVRVLLFSSAITLLLTSFQLYFDYRYAVRAIESRLSEIEGSYLQSLGRQTQAALAHVTRVATLGELTASIAHEINQPLGAM